MSSCSSRDCEKIICDGRSFFSPLSPAELAVRRLSIFLKHFVGRHQNNEVYQCLFSLCQAFAQNTPLRIRRTGSVQGFYFTHDTSSGGHFNHAVTKSAHTACQTVPVLVQYHTGPSFQCKNQHNFSAQQFFSAPHNTCTKINW